MISASISSSLIGEIPAGSIAILARPRRVRKRVIDSYFADNTAPTVSVDGPAVRSTSEAQLQLSGVVSDDNGLIASL